MCLCCFPRVFSNKSYCPHCGNTCLRTSKCCNVSKHKAAGPDSGRSRQPCANKNNNPVRETSLAPGLPRQYGVLDPGTAMSQSSMGSQGKAILAPAQKRHTTINGMRRLIPRGHTGRTDSPKELIRRPSFKDGSADDGPSHTNRKKENLKCSSAAILPATMILSQQSNSLSRLGVHTQVVKYMEHPLVFHTKTKPPLSLPNLLFYYVRCSPTPRRASSLLASSDDIDTWYSRSFSFHNDEISSLSSALTL
ncbi:hypothetical protein MOQ_005494 [Trypanosoma cruzi marinkellei]|uniref:Uncharacterized protein n=1 Tax=Trypanosoma cruzi marinkellei TaxID=85056 RepID=K2N7L5_TRYCR|nr:hypothetical protein MOQ_005494 [Trypanosoma cruzi marinkellei]